MINGQTSVFGLIGFPVKHTFSPNMHNSAFSKLGVNGVYFPFEVKPENLHDAISGLKSIGVKGFNVTIPHKENIIKYLDKLSPEAKFIGAVNTVLVKDDLMIGYNTDGLGFIDSLKADLKFNPKGKSVFIFGAGGAARAISFSLALAGAKRIIFTDLDSKKALVLAKELSAKTRCEVFAVKFDKTALGELILNSDLLVNASPCGMHDKDTELVDKRWLHKNLAVYDCIYNPLKTKLIKSAIKNKLRYSNGLGMLLRQGVKAFEIWTGLKAPVDIMKNALNRAIKK